MNNGYQRDELLEVIHNKNGTDKKQYIEDRISEITKCVSLLREQMVNLQERIEGCTNSDERMHLEYDLKDLKTTLADFTDTLDILKNLYSDSKS